MRIKVKTLGSLSTRGVPVFLDTNDVSFVKFFKSANKISLVMKNTVRELATIDIEYFPDAEQVFGGEYDKEVVSKPSKEIEETIKKTVEVSVKKAIEVAIEKVTKKMAKAKAEVQKNKQAGTAV